MKINRQFRRRGFTLVEIMGAVEISSVIILLLYKVFDKVQSVFVVSQNRARAMEQGRVAMDMLVTDFQALDAAARYDPDTGEIPNIFWAYSTVEVDYLSPEAVDAACNYPAHQTCSPHGANPHHW